MERGGEPSKALELAPTFIVGLPRSGTTLLTAMLNAHSDLAIPPETHYYNRYATQCERDGGITHPEAFVRHVRRFLGGDDAPPLEPRDLDALRQRLISGEDRTHRAVLEGTMETYASRRGARRWGEKTPIHLDYLPSILKDFPRARVVQIIRDPRDVLLSLRGVPWSTRGALYHLRWWERAVAAPRRWDFLRAGNYLEVRYEDLVTSVEHTLRQVCAFLHLEFEPEMLEFHRSADVPAALEREPWKSNVTRPVDAANTGKWRTAMSEVEAATIDATIGRELDRMGYPRSGARSISTGLRRALLWLDYGIRSCKHYLGRARARW